MSRGRTNRELGLWFGVVLGIVIGPVTTAIVGLPVVLGFGYGIAGGMFVGWSAGLVIDRAWIDFLRDLVIVFGLLWGGTNAALLGAILAWSFDLHIVSGLVVGGLGGIAGGTLLGFFLHLFAIDTRELPKR